MNDSDLINRINDLPDILSSHSNSIDAMMLDVKEIRNKEEVNKQLVDVEKAMEKVKQLVELLVKDTGYDPR